MNSLVNNEIYLFFGVSGSGKSSTINTLCGETKCVVGDGESSETQNCKLVQVIRPDSIFHDKSLLDMQGYNDTRVEYNTAKLFELMKLYFLESKITKVKCIIFVISMSDKKTNFYLRFLEFLSHLFIREQIQQNSLVLLTSGDILSPIDNERKLENIRQNLIELRDKYGWHMQIVEWSNSKALPDQEKKLFGAISRLSGFDPKLALQEVEKKIDAEAILLYESDENIKTVKHDAKMELIEVKVDRLKEDYIVVDYNEVIKNTVPAQTEKHQSIINKYIHFQGNLTDNEPEEFKPWINTLGRLAGVTGASYIVCQLAGRENRKQTHEIRYEHPVVNVRFDKSPDDIHLLDELTYTIDPNDPKLITVNAHFSWGGSPIMEWNFDLVVSATVENIIVVKKEYVVQTAIPRQRVEKVMKTVTDTEKQLVEVQKAYEEKIYKRTKDEIKKSLIHQRIIAMS